MYKYNLSTEGEIGYRHLLIYEVRIYSLVHGDGPGLVLPVGGEDKYGFRLHLFGNFFPNALEHGVDWMFGLVLDVWLT